MALKFIAKKLLIFYLKKNKRSKISYSVHLNFKTKLGGCNALHDRSVLSGTHIGFASFIGRDSHLANTLIGRYCSIAHNVEVISHTHPSSNFASTHPAFYSRLRQSGFTYSETQKFDENLKIDRVSDFAIEIGNDVWIGAHTLIMGGVKIGDGAIVGAGSVVTKNIPSYAIVGGVPAKLIRMRFSDAEIKYLQSLKWWLKSSDWLKKNCHYFSDIKTMMKEIPTVSD